MVFLGPDCSGESHAGPDNRFADEESGLGTEAFDAPGSIRLQTVLEAIMEAIGASLPEFDCGRVEDEAAPMIGHGHHIIWKLCGETLHAVLEFSAAGKESGLRANPRGEPAAAGAGIEIGEGFVMGQRKDLPPGTHLAFEQFPMEADGGARVGCEFAAFTALQVGEELEASRIQALEKHRANGGLSSRIHRGERHGGGLGVIRLESAIEPALELGQGIREQIASA